MFKGDIVVLSSDGVVEVTNGRGGIFGFERLEQAIAAGPTTSAEAMLEHLILRLNKHRPLTNDR